MNKTTELTKEEYEAIIDSFYSYFETGYKFEAFLKQYLKKIGLEEVVVTKASRDGGIDLTAIRKGIGELDGQDFINYTIQAKRYKPDNSVTAESVRALRGVIDNGVGVFITTGKFSKNTKEEFEKYKNTDRPIILIDGTSLVNSCIDNEFGFIFKPVFDKDSMDILMGLNKKYHQDVVFEEIKELSDIVVEKQITANDIRARILSIPKIILNTFPDGAEKLEVCFNGNIIKELSINKGRNYFAGVTELYRTLGLLTNDGTITPAKSIWTSKDKKLYIEVITDLIEKE